MRVLHILTAWLAATFLMTFLTFLVFARDDSIANGKLGPDWRRVPEICLLSLIALGGWPGALLSFGVLHHKSNAERKSYFHIVTYTAAFLWFAALIVCLITGGKA